MNAKRRDRYEIYALINDTKVLLTERSNLKVTKVKREFNRVEHELVFYASTNDGWFLVTLCSYANELYQYFVSHDCKDFPYHMKDLFIVKKTYKQTDTKEQILSIEHPLTFRIMKHFQSTEQIIARPCLLRQSSAPWVIS